MVLYPDGYGIFPKDIPMQKSYAWREITVIGGYQNKQPRTQKVRSFLP